MSDDFEMEMIDARNALGIVIFREQPDGQIVSEIKGMKVDKLTGATLFWQMAKQLKAMHEAEATDREDGCKPGCRHRCPVCRMGLVSHLTCDPQCELRTNREVGSHEGHRIQESPTLTGAVVPRFCRTCETEIAPRDPDA